MPPVSRVLDDEPVATLAAYAGAGGGRGLEAARRLGAGGALDDLEASGLRGRGGAGFPTATKWRAVVENQSAVGPPTVVVNAAEGEPGTFKDRMLLRRNPYRVLEGALAAATVVGSDRLVVALKATFHEELERVRAAIAEVAEAGWADGIQMLVFEGPGEYLYGEETALLEAIDGRQPFPRIAPPFRHGVDEVGDDTASAAEVVMAAPEKASVAPPALVNNAETMAHVAMILAEGPDWFRQLGTAESPGTVVCTVSGATRRHGVAEFAMGTPLREILDTVGGGPAGGRYVAAMSGVANPLVPEHLFDTPLTYEDMRDAGSGVGAAGFIVFDDRSDLLAVAHGVSRFLAVESCGQCTPCKQDGLAIAGLLDGLLRGEGGENDLPEVAERVSTVADRARCYLAHQHQQVIGSILRLFPEALAAPRVAGGELPGAEAIAAMVDLVDGRAVLDERHRDKQPDWTYDETYSGQSPADRIDQRAPQPPQ